MRRRLDRFVKNEIFQSDIPPKTNKRFFPRLKTIRSHMVEALRKLRYSKIDQECLSKKIEQWKFENSSDRIYFQPKGTAESTSGLCKRIFFLNWNQVTASISEFKASNLDSQNFNYCITIQPKSYLKNVQNVLLLHQGKTVTLHYKSKLFVTILGSSFPQHL